jgi:hypothetical protein
MKKVRGEIAGVGTLAVSHSSQRNAVSGASGRVSLLLISNYGEISRTATGDAPLPRIGCPLPVPQPAMLMIIAGI